MTTKRQCEITSTLEWLDQLGWYHRWLYKSQIARAKGLLLALKAEVGK